MAKVPPDIDEKAAVVEVGVGKGRVVIANSLRLLNLPEDLRKAVAEGTISAGHARNLVSVSDEKLQQEIDGAKTEREA